VVVRCVSSRNLVNEETLAQEEEEEEEGVRSYWMTLRTGEDTVN